MPFRKAIYFSKGHLICLEPYPGFTDEMISEVFTVNYPTNFFAFVNNSGIPEGSFPPAVA